MIQRIQSIYLLVVTILMSTMFFYPLAKISSAEHEYILRFNGLYENTNGNFTLYTDDPIIPIIALLVIITVISFVSIFLYKKRILQMRLNSFNIIIMLGFVGLSYYYIRNFSGQLNELLNEELIVSYEIAFIFPFISAILTYLAIRAIGKDEALIRSMDRIR